MLLAHWPWFVSRPLHIEKNLTRKQWRKFEDELHTVSKNQSYTDMFLICLHVMFSKATSPLVRQYQQALNDISTRHAVGLFWVPGHAVVRGNEIAEKLARSVSGQRFIGPEPYLGVSRQNIRRKMKSWVEKQHLALWRCPCGTKTQARELISGSNLAIGARLLSFNRTQSRAVIGLLTGHNTLRIYLHVMGLSADPNCRKCGTEEETSVHILCECEAWPHSGVSIWVPSF
jgi:hypothetical protein